MGSPLQFQAHCALLITRPRQSHGGAVSQGSPVTHGNSRDISRTAIRRMIIDWS